MINLHERMLPTSGVEPVTSWSPVGRRIQLSHRGRHWNGTILAILNFCVTVMPPIKFQLSQTYDLGGDVV